MSEPSPNSNSGWDCTNDEGREARYPQENTATTIFDGMLRVWRFVWIGFQLNESHSGIVYDTRTQRSERVLAL